jgi:hypothetical protein
MVPLGLGGNDLCGVGECVLTRASPFDQSKGFPSQDSTKNPTCARILEHFNPSSSSLFPFYMLLLWSSSVPLLDSLLPLAKAVYYYVLPPFKHLVICHSLSRFIRLPPSALCFSSPWPRTNPCRTH